MSPNNVGPFIGPFIGLGWGLMWFVFWAVIIVQARRERARLYDMFEKLLAEGKPAPPELLEVLRRRGGPTSDLRTGLILIAVGVGLAVSGVINYYQYKVNHPTSELFHGPFGLFPIPLLIGVAFLIVGYMRKKDLAGR